MASILKVDELQGIVSAGDITVTSEGGAATQSLQQGLAKHWMKFDQVGGNSVRDSFNLSSLTDIAAAQAGINFTNSFANDDYAMTGTGSNTYSNTSSKDIVMLEDQTNTSSLSNVCIKYGGAANGEDRNHISVVHHGDLA
jgi:hypothetical protein